MYSFFSNRFIIWLTAILFPAALLVIAYIILQYQHSDNMDSTIKHIGEEFRLISEITHDKLQKGNYQDLDELFSTWGKNDHLLVSIKLTSENGFVLSQYNRSHTAEHPYNSTTELRYSYDGLATLNVIQDLSELYKQHDRLAYQLLGGVVPITLAIWFLIYLINRMNHEIIHRQQTEEELFKEKEYAEVTLHSIGDAVITTDNHGIITFINPIAEGLTGWTTQEARGNLLEDVFNIVNESTMEPCENPVQDCLRQGRSVGLTNYTALIKRDGTRISIDDSASPIRNRSGDIIGVILVFHDVTRDREMTRQISWQATHDSLTGLINRNELEIRLNEVINDAKVESASNCFLYMDLDQFKVVNDTCGHQAGDKLLEQLSYLLQQNIRDSDILARLGGDEFGVLLTGCSIEKATSIAEMLRKTVEEFRFIWQEKTFEIGASIGVVSINPNDDSTATLLSAADIACYAAKDHGRNRVHVYHPDDKELMQRHGEMKWVSQITKALKEDRFELFCQSIQKINNATQNEYHFEILVRMLDEENKYIPPGFFIPAAERYDLMPKIDEWVLKNTFKIIQKNKNSSAFNKLHTVSINLSGNTFSSKDFLGRIREMLKIYEVPTSMICFEITETAAIANLTEAITFIQALKNDGCRFSLDDFGSGLSSFSYLKNLPVDYLKIDGIFVKNIVDDPIDLAMVNAIHQIGTVLGIKTVAEFVENKQILEHLRGIGVDYAQGYGIHVPEPFESWLKSIE